MAGSCCGGGGGARTTPRVAGVPCNALQATADGLLVPATDLEAIAPGTAVGTARSVDIDVTAPDGGDCPQVWQVGARLTPAWGEAPATGPLNLLPLAAGTWAPVPGMEFTAPEAGVYRIAADVMGVIDAAAQSVFNFVIEARLALNGTAVPGTLRTVVQHYFVHTPPATQSGGQNQNATVSKLLQLAAGDVVRVECDYVTTNGTASVLRVNGAPQSLLTWHKITD